MPENAPEDQPAVKPSFLKRAFDSAAACALSVVLTPVALIPRALVGPGYDGSIMSGLCLGIAFTAVTAMAYKSSFKSYKDSYTHLVNKNVESCAAACGMVFLMYLG